MKLIRPNHPWTQPATVGRRAKRAGEYGVAATGLATFAAFIFAPIVVLITAGWLRP